MTSLRAKMMLAVSVLAIAAVIAVGMAVRLGARQGFTRYQELERVEQSDKLPEHRRTVAEAVGPECCTQEQLTNAAALLEAREVLLVVTPDDKIVATAGAPLTLLRIVSVKRNDAEMHLEAERSGGEEKHRVSLVLRMNGVPVRLIGGGTANYM